MPKRLFGLLVAFALGFGCAFLSLAFWPQPADPPLSDLRYLAPPTGEPALSTEHLEGRIVPFLQQEALAAKGEVLDACSGPIERAAVKLGYPRFVRAVPPFVHKGIEFGVSELNKFSVKQLIEWLDRAVANQPPQAGPNDGRLLRELRELRSLRAAHP